MTNNQDYTKLTSLLYIKADTSTITHQELTTIFNNIVSLIIPNQVTTKVIDTIYYCADTISQELQNLEIDLEKKIVLSIATRLKAEEFMIDKISNPPQKLIRLREIRLSGFFEIYKTFTNELSNIESLDKVNLMTAENIHLNSFMYEPLLDMSDSHLKSLYLEIKNLV